MKLLWGGATSINPEGMREAMRLADTRTFLGLRVFSEELSIHLESEDRKAVAQLLAVDTATGMIMTDAGSIKLSGTIGGLQLRDTTQAGKYHSNVISNMEVEIGEISVVNWTVDMLQPLFAFELRLRGKGVRVHYLNRFVLELVECIKQQIIPSFYAFSLAENDGKEVQEEGGEKKSDDPTITPQDRTAVPAPKTLENVDKESGRTIIEVLLVESVAEIGMNSGENSDYLILTFEKLQLWWANEMTGPPGEFLEAGYLPGVVFSSPSAGEFAYFEDIEPDTYSSTIRPNCLRTLSHNPKEDIGEEHFDEDSDDSEFFDAEQYTPSFESGEAPPPGLLCIRLSGTALGSMKCEDIMGTNIMIECSVLLSDDELIAVNINAPRLPLHLNEQQYGALLGMIYGNFAELPVIVPPLLPEKCPICGGHHFDNLQCYKPWLTLTLSIDEAPVTVMDTVSNTSKVSTHDSMYTRHGMPIARIDFGRLVYEMANLNCETGESFIYSMELEITDLEPSTNSRFRGVLSPRKSDMKKVNQGKEEYCYDGSTKEGGESKGFDDGQSTKDKNGECWNDGSPQLVFKSIATWTTSVMNIDISRSCIVGYGGVLSSLASFFYNPISDPAYIPDMWLHPPTPKIDEGMDLRIVTKDCLICLVEHIEDEHPRAMVLQTDIEYSQTWRGDAIIGPGISQLNLKMIQRALFFTHLPVTASRGFVMSVLKPFRINLSHDYRVSDPALATLVGVEEKQQHLPERERQVVPYTGQSNIALTVDEIYCEVSFQDCQLLLQSVSTLIASFISDLVTSAPEANATQTSIAQQAPLGPDTPRGRSRASPTLMDDQLGSAREPSLLSMRYIAEEGEEDETGDEKTLEYTSGMRRTRSDHVMDGPAHGIHDPIPHDEDDEEEHESPMSIEHAVGDVGAIRLVLMHNMLGVPLFDVALNETSLLLAKQDKAMGGSVSISLSANYFNNMIHSWEPAVETIRIGLQVGSDKNGRPLYHLTCESGIRVNFTSALLRIATHPSLQQDVVTTEMGSMKPYLVKNLTGIDALLMYNGALHRLEQGDEIGLGSSRRKVLGGDYNMAYDIEKRDDLISFAFPGTGFEAADEVSLETVSTFAIPMVDLGAGPTSSAMSKLSKQVNQAGYDSKVSLMHHQRARSSFDRPSTAFVIGKIALNDDGRKVMIIKSAVEVTNTCDEAVEVCALGIEEEFQVKIASGETAHIPAPVCDHRLSLSVRPSANYKFTPIKLRQKMRNATATIECPSVDKDAKSIAAMLAREMSTQCYRVDILTSRVSKQEFVQDSKRLKIRGQRYQVKLQSAVTIGPQFLLQNLNGTPTFYKISGEEDQVFAEGLLQPGQQIPLHQLDMNQNIFISLVVPNYAWSKKEQFYSKKQGYDKRRTVVPVTMKGLTFSNPKRSHHSIGTITVPALTLRVEVKGRKILFFAPVWIKNCSGLPLNYRGSESSTQQLIRGSKSAPYYVHSANKVSPFPNTRLNTQHNANQAKSAGDKKKVKIADSDKVAHSLESSIDCPKVIFSIAPASNRHQRIVIAMPSRKRILVMADEKIDMDLRENDVTRVPSRFRTDTIAQSNTFIDAVSSSTTTVDATAGKNETRPRRESADRQKSSKQGKIHLDVPCTYFDLFEAIRKRCRMGLSAKAEDFRFKLGGRGQAVIMSQHIPLSSGTQKIELNIEHKWEQDVLQRQHSFHDGQVSKSSLPSEYFENWPEYLSVTEGVAHKRIPGSKKLKTKESIQIKTGASEWSHTVHVRERLEGTISMKSNDPDARVPMIVRSLRNSGSFASFRAASERQEERSNSLLSNKSAKSMRLLGSESDKLTSRVATYELSLSVSSAPGMFYRTRILRVYPRFRLINRTPRMILLRQFIAPEETDHSQLHTMEDASLESESVMDFQWPHADRKQALQFMFGGGISGQTWEWSGELRLDMLGDHAITLRRQGHGVRAKYLLRVSVKMTDFSSLVVTFLPESRRYPPFRIKNDTHLGLRISQSKIKVPYWEPVNPRRTIPFAWDQPFVSDPHLRIEFPMSSSKSKKKDFSLSRNRKFKTFEIPSRTSSENLKIAVSIEPDGPTKVITIREETHVGRKSSMEALLDSKRLREQITRKLENASKGAAGLRNAVVRDIHAKSIKISKLRNVTKKKARELHQRMRKGSTESNKSSFEPRSFPQNANKNNRKRQKNRRQSQMLFARIARKSVMAQHVIRQINTAERTGKLQKSRSEFTLTRKPAIFST